MASSVVKFSSTCIVAIVLGLVIYVTQYTSLRHRLNTIALRLEGKRDVYVNSSRIENGSIIVDGVNTDNEIAVKLNLPGFEGFVNEGKQLLATDPETEHGELPGAKYFKRDRNVPDINCRRLFDGDETELELAHNLIETHSIAAPITAQEYIDTAADCPRFTKERGYILSPLDKMEEDFPIAFSILMFKDVEQSERLLRAIYRPQNFYCIHVDKKSEPSVYNAMKAISNCFENVFMASKRFNVQWGEISVLEPELLCMTQLWNRSKTWKYFINLTGQEFPLRTNFELVRILMAYNGANDLEGTIKRANKNRWENAGPPPHNIVPVKGSVHVVVNRDFVDYILHNPVARDLLEWARNVTIPDETFFASLNHNPHLGIKGSYKGDPETNNTGNVKPFLARHKNWPSAHMPCYGKRVRLVCVFGIGDLKVLGTRRGMFVNKFHLDYQHFALDCMEELLFNNTRDEYMGKMEFDSQYYSELGFVKNKVT